MLNLVRSRSELSSNFLIEKETCLKCFDSWPESDQVSYLIAIFLMNHDLVQFIFS